MGYQAEKRLLLVIVLGVFVALGIAPKADRFTWFLENSPVLLGLAVLLVTERYFTFSRLVYRVMSLHAIILIPVHERSDSVAAAPVALSRQEHVGGN